MAHHFFANLWYIGAQVILACGLKLAMLYVNTTGYKFKKITDLNNLKATLQSTCTALSLKGTILLAQEGINILLSGSRKNIDAFYSLLPTLQIENIAFKESLSDALPFRRMQVKIKPEIVTMGVPSIQPVEQSAPTLSAAMLEHWMTSGKTMLLLDTRNDYEVRLGKFAHAIDLNIKNFRSFPQAVKQLPTKAKETTVVTYCTGGIRCEKAALYLLSQGFKNVFQLEGGILKYLEQYPSSHFHGECFVFDKRIALNTQLEETDTVQCSACRAPVTRTQQTSPYYLSGKACPACFPHLPSNPTQQQDKQHGTR